MSAPAARALDAALRLARQGVPCFPVRPDKRPACPHGFRDASCDGPELRALWRAYPAPLVGIRTGAASGLDALDLDTARHPEAASWLAAHRHRLPQTRAHRSRSGGLHLLFRHRPGTRTTANRPVVGGERKADDACLTWWPAAGFPVLARGPLADWPTWLLAATEPPPAPVLAAPRPLPADASRRRRYVEGAIRNAVTRVAQTREGGRNIALNAEAFALMRFVAEGELTPRDVAEAMAVAAHAAGIGAREAQSTIASALRAGGRA